MAVTHAVLAAVCCPLTSPYASTVNCMDGLACASQMAKPFNSASFDFDGVEQLKTHVLNTVISLAGQAAPCQHHG